jgi:orotidine-5'-phosphate decarboxylase
MTANPRIMQPEERVIVALDTATREDARSIVDRLGEHAGFYKVGIGLFLAAGPDFVRELGERGKKIFFDLKFHDIPAQVSLASRVSVRLGASLVNVHSIAGSQIMGAVLSAVKEEAEMLGKERPRVVAVTLLTSLAGVEDSWGRMRGADQEVSEMVVTMARITGESGLDGVVCSGQEVAAVKRAMGDSFLTVVPGIRPQGSAPDDQRRVLTPGAAIREGADYLVVGRPITGDPDPLGALKSIHEEIERAGSG